MPEPIMIDPELRERLPATYKMIQIAVGQLEHAPFSQQLVLEIVHALQADLKHYELVHKNQAGVRAVRMDPPDPHQAAIEADAEMRG